MESSNERWVEERLAALDGERAWQPDASRAWARMRRRDGDLRVRRAGWFGATAASLAAALLLMLVANPQACANPIECVNETAPAGYKLIGPAAAPVTVEFYSDYQCHPCAAALAALEQSARAGKIRILLRDLPMPEHR